jgi:hypothetical protein
VSAGRPLGQGVCPSLVYRHKLYIHIILNNDHSKSRIIRMNGSVRTRSERVPINVLVLPARVRQNNNAGFG